MRDEGGVAVHDVDGRVRGVLKQRLETAEATLHQLGVGTEQAVEEDRYDSVVQEDFGLEVLALGQRSQRVDGVNRKVGADAGERGLGTQEFDELGHG